MLVEPQVNLRFAVVVRNATLHPFTEPDDLRVYPSRSSGLTRKTCSKSVAASRGLCAPQFLIFVTEAGAWQFTTKLE